MNAIPPLPEASANAGAVDHLFLGLLLLSGLMLVVLGGLNTYFLIRYRRGSRAPRPAAPTAEWKIETAWIAGTTLIFVGIFAWGAILYVRQARSPSGTYDIEVTARQWMWDIRQPNGRREFNTLHVPAGQPVRLLMESEDVIHSFYVPAFRLKQDVVPGKRVSLWFSADQPGTYRLFCAEFCGTAHAAMIGQVIVQPPADYAAWLDRGGVATELRARGQRLFIERGCSGCHAPTSSFHAPRLEGLFGRPVRLADGREIIADERYLTDSILQPAREVVAGYENLMPPYDQQINRADLLDLVAYLKSLDSETDTPAPVAPAPRAKEDSP